MFLMLFSAMAGGLVSPPPPAAPTVDFSSLAATADVEPKAPDGTVHPVRARLLTDKASVAPGETIRVGLHLTQQPGWHTYWKSPGDIGLPTNIEWKVPDGFATSPYQYPVPQRFHDDDNISFGYENEVLLFTELTVPATATPGDITLAADADWLVCKTSCIHLYVRKF